MKTWGGGGLRGTIGGYPPDKSSTVQTASEIVNESLENK